MAGVDAVPGSADENSFSVDTCSWADDVSVVTNPSDSKCWLTHVSSGG